MNDLIDINSVKNRLLMVRGEPSLLDRDVASLYGVETREVNQAVRNNPAKFPQGFVLELAADEVNVLRSKNLILEPKAGKGHHSKHGYKVFTERGLYMLATILKSKQATAATLAIINAYAQLRSMVRDVEALQSLKDGSPEQARQLSRAGHKLAELTARTFRRTRPRRPSISIWPSSRSRTSSRARNGSVDPLRTRKTI